ncbi:hypothetical protein P148_SR1C00001G0794 [candidate division SR1 bacterium RAAC1_SR1_1]|nr:hypothetical protein P148_SR1C00001G0794 [candidate division SR1 bacterium RAAC1_SR1_1]
MTDPIIQNQAQGGTNPMPVQAEPQIDFDLNLPANEETPTNEEPIISLDFDDIQKTQIDNTQETNVNDSSFVEEVKVEAVPVVETPVVEATIVETPAVETPVVEAPVIETPVIEVKEDNRLDQEDALVEESKKDTEATPVIETKKEPEIKEESLNMFSEEIVETPIVEAPVVEAPVIEEAPVVEQPIEQTIIQQEIEKPVPGEPQQNFPPSTNLQQDQAIIQQIQASAGKPSEPVVSTPVAPTATEVNLDDLLNTPAPQNQATTQPVIAAPMPQMPAFTGIHGYSLPPIATQIGQQIKQPLNKKILINFGVGIIALVVGGFMFKTMYPLEYQKIVGNTPETGIESELTNPIETTGEGTDVEPTDGLFENPALTNYHAAAEDNSGSNGDFNAFEDIEQTMTDDNAKIKEQLQKYVDEGKKYLVIGKRTNDKNITKYSLFLYKKATALLLDIENGTQISTDELDTQLADFETYLQKLTGTGSNDEILPTQPITPTPEEFFGSENSGTTQEETVTPAEIPTTTESGSTTQETETPAENLSGN